MTMLRMLLPWIIGAISFLVLLWFVIAQVLKNVTLEKNEIKGIKSLRDGVGVFVVVLLFLRIITMGSVNETPRSVIDRTVPAQMNNDFEERAKRQADSPKNCDSTMKNCQPNKR